ncbi:MAG: SRPBCC domain-containing protein [Bdellovibrionota bacterium]
MDQNTTQTTTTNHKMNLPTAPLVEVVRIFHAPVERIWNAWYDAELVKQWWGPHGYTSPSAKIDFRVGGKFLLAMKSPDGSVIWSTGVYEEIVPNEKIVCTDSFADENGNIVSPSDIDATMSNMPERLYITIEFQHVNLDQTKMVISHEGIPLEMHDDCVRGWAGSIDKLQQLVERN